MYGHSTQFDTTNNQFDHIVHQSRIQYRHTAQHVLSQRDLQVLYIDTFEPINLHNNTNKQYVSQFDQLDKNILNIVVSYLTVTELISIRSLNSTLRELLFSPALWQNAVSDHTNTYQGLCWYLLLQQSNTLKLNLSFKWPNLVTSGLSCYTVGMMLRDIITEIQLSGYSDTCVRLLNNTLHHMYNVKKLIFTGYAFDCWSSATFEGMPALHVLDTGEYIYNTFNLKYLLRLSQLHELNITITNNIAIKHIQQFKNLHRLRLRINVIDQTINIDDYAKQLQSIPNVRILGIRGVSYK